MPRLQLAIAICVLAVIDLGAAEPYKILDEKPKVIFYLSNSHQGHAELQEHLDHAGYPHVTVVLSKLDHYKWHLDPETGKLPEPDTYLGKKIAWAAKEHPGHDLVMVRQTNGGPFHEKKQPGTDWAVQSNGAYFTRFREAVMARGFKDVYILNHHYSKTAPKVRHDDFVEAIAAFNEAVGYEVGVDNWPVTKPYYPRSVGTDYWHNNHFGKLAKTWPLMATFARNSGLDDYKAIDLDAALEAYEAEHKHFTHLAPVGEGQTYRVGDTIDITWRVRDEALYPRVSLLLEVPGGRMYIAENLPAAREHYRWTIPDTEIKTPWDKRARTVPIVSDRCRLQVGLAHEDFRWTMKTSSATPGFFAIAPADSPKSDAPEPGPAPAPVPEVGVHALEQATVRIARWPTFKRAAIGMAIVDDGSAELLAELENFSRREHPDLMTVLVDPARADTQAERWKILTAMGHEVVQQPDYRLRRGVTQVVHRVLPDDLGAVPVYHIEKGSQQAMRNLIDQVLARGGAAFLTYGDRGTDFSTQVDSLHEYHTELWNGPAHALLAYVAQRRAAKIAIAQYGRNGARLAVTDALDDAVYHQPLWLQVPRPHHRFTPKTYTQGKRSGTCITLTTGDKRVLHRFPVIPDAGEVVLE